MATNRTTTPRTTVTTTIVGVLAVIFFLGACGGKDESAPAVNVQSADGVQIVDADEAEDLLKEGEERVTTSTTSPSETEETSTTLAVSEAGRSFQTRLGTALTVFNTCLGEAGYTFVGIPGQTEDPIAAEPEYLTALIECNNQSGIANVLQEQGVRQQDLTADEKKEANESGRTVFGCLIDRGWDLGELEPNDNGILSPSRFPAVPPSRQDEFQRDLDACGWNDLELG